MSIQPRPRSGAQFVLSHGDHRAVIASVGASLRTYTFAGRDIVNGFSADEIRPSSRGALLAPWPNRLEDGTYTFGGVEYTLPLTEPKRGNAHHGLVHWLEWSRTSTPSEPDSAVTLGVRLPPQVGYPFDLGLTATYSLSDAGLDCTLAATNLGSGSAPYGVGAHPYLRAPGPMESWTLTLPVREHLVVDERMIPRSVAPVAGTDVDFSAPRVIGDTVLDDGFTGLVPDAEGRFRVSVTDASGTGSEISWDPEQLGWTQVYSADKPGAPTHRLGLAVEPMSCPANALRSGDGLVVLAPGETHTANWTIRALG